MMSKAFGDVRAPSSEISSSLGISAKKGRDKLSKEQNAQVEEIYKRELGFTRIIQLLQSSKKPLVGHNLFFDVAFLYEQFIGRLPKTFAEFATAWKSHFAETYDTKSLAESAGEFPKTALSHLYFRCNKDKRISNNLMFGFDEKASPRFAHYEKAGAGQEHDAGYDSYMTGHVFAALAKRLEIGQLLEQSSRK